MNFFDQFDDHGFSRITVVMERNARDKIARGGMVVISDYRKGTLDLQDIFNHMLGGVQYEGYGDARGMMAKMLNGVESMKNQVRLPVDSEYFRPAVRDLFECALPEEGKFPVGDPLQALMSLMYAKAQGAPSGVMIRIKGPLSDHFGPRTSEHIEQVIDHVPEKLITDPANKIMEYGEVHDGLPPFHTFIPELITRVKSLNDLTKGKLDSILKEISDEYLSSKAITSSDRDFQKKVLGALESLIGKSEVFRLSKKQPRELVFNTRLPAGRPGVIKVRGILLDKSKLESMTFKECMSSMSPQVAEAIFDDDKKNLDVAMLVRLIERLSDLDIPEDEKKEIEDRMINPIKHFFEPEEEVIDKIMMVNAR